MSMSDDGMITMCNDSQTDWAHEQDMKEETFECLKEDVGDEDE